MPAGLQTFNADGSVQVDVTSRLTRWVGTYTVAASRAAWTFFPVAGMSLDGWAAFVAFLPHQANIQIVNGGFQVRRSEQPQGGSDLPVNYTVIVFRY